MKNKIVKIIMAAVGSIAIVMYTTTVTGKEKVSKDYLDMTTVTSYCCTFDGVQLYTNDGKGYWLEVEQVQQDTETQVYNIGTESDYDKLYKALENRNGKIIIEISNGTVINGNGDGVDVCGYYRCYDTDKFNVGDKVQSVFVYNPGNNCIDDILYRIDTLIQ